MHTARRTGAVLIALALAAPLRAGDSNQEVFEKAYSMEGVVKISVENVNGNIAATAWDKPYFKLRATKHVEGGHADEILRLTEIRVEKVGNEIKVETVNPKRRRLFGSSGAHVDYELQIPAKTDVRFETSNGKLVANGFAGTISGDAVNGSIELAGIAGPTNANTVNGNVRLAFAGPLHKTRIETVNGSIDVAFDKSSSVRYELETVNGHIEGSFDMPVEGKFGPKEARGSLNGGTEPLHCETVNGTIRLKTI